MLEFKKVKGKKETSFKLKERKTPKIKADVNDLNVIVFSEKNDIEIIEEFKK